MMALVYHGSANRQWESKEDPKVQMATDAIVKIDTTTIRGTNLHILKGNVPAVTDEHISGHEAVGTVVETGTALGNVKGGGQCTGLVHPPCGRRLYRRSGCTATASTGADGPWVTS